LMRLNISSSNCPFMFRKFEESSMVSFLISPSQIVKWIFWILLINLLLLVVPSWLQLGAVRKHYFKPLQHYAIITVIKFQDLLRLIHLFWIWSGTQFPFEKKDDIFDLFICSCVGHMHIVPS
jgi:hypothetical protein